MTTIYELPKETAKKIRKALKAAFSGIKFSVTTDRYTGGSSANINWVNGPTQAEVQKVANKFTSHSFDGMDDSTERHGYEFEGKRYMGVGYVFATRGVE